MKQSKKLEAIIDFAVGRGYDECWSEGSGDTLHIMYGEKVRRYTDWQTLLFSHDFAKAVFGDTHNRTRLHNGRDYCPSCRFQVGENDKFEHDCFQYHLQQAVIADDPISYYFEYIKEK